MTTKWDENKNMGQKDKNLGQNAFFFPTLY